MQVHDENGKNAHAHALPSKTPSRTGPAGGLGKAALLNTAGPAARLGLGTRTEGKDRNVLGLGKTPGPSQAGKGKGKEKEKDGEDIGTSPTGLHPMIISAFES